jgi:pheromone shutdown protein TraB
MLMQLPNRAMQLMRATTSLVRVARALGRDLYELAKLEARLALSAAATVAGLGVAVLFLAATAWLLLVGSLVTWMADRWLSLPVALLVTGVALVVVAIAVGFIAARVSRRMGFPETRRRIDEVMSGRQVDA